MPGRNILDSEAVIILRQKRKIEHVYYALELEDTGSTGFADLFLVPCAAPELRLEQVDCTCLFLGKKLRAPLLINAMTGGHPDVLEINAALGEVASRTGIAVAVGSQRAALENPGVRKTYTIMREKNPGGVVLANLDAGCRLEGALEAVEMVQADGIQLYLNVAQELSMPEGDVDFRGVMDNIARLVDELPVPVIVKEVGFGMSRETVKSLADMGVKYLDIGGRGGTNFAAIEGRRQGKSDVPLLDWGIPTAPALLEALSVSGNVEIIASGGIRSAADVAKALVAGAGLVGIARPFLQILMERGTEGLVEYIEEMKTGLRSIMMALGAGRLDMLRTKQLVITGMTAQWLMRRGIDINQYACR